MTTFIYCLIDPVTNCPRYIGKSNTPEKRVLAHVNESKRYRFRRACWIKSLTQKGLKLFLHIIDEVSNSEWKFWETHYISLYRSWGFDLVNGNEGGTGMSNPSEETRLKMRIAKLGKTNSWKGRHHTSESNEKNRLAHLGRKNGPPSEETRDKIRKSNSIPIYQFSLNGKFLKKWDSIKEAAKSIGVDRTVLSDKRRKTVGGFVWSKETTIK